MSFRAALLFLLAAALPLGGCEMLAGADKGKDGESVGYACRLSSKLPEDCMKENDIYTPTSILEGWKRGEKEVREGKVGSLTGKSQPAESEGAPKAEAKPETKPKPEGESVPAEPLGAEKLVPEAKPVPDAVKH
jgi:hypothetical protein